MVLFIICILVDRPNVGGGGGGGGGGRAIAHPQPDYAAVYEISFSKCFGKGEAKIP